MRDGDTIVALSSGALPSGVAVLRLSGPRAGELLAELAGTLPLPRQLTLATLADAGEVIDRGLVAWFPAPHSFTGEDCAELQVHGSRAVVRALLRRLTTRDGVRLAAAGEFTRRAFENGKLDLTEIEGLGDLIDADTEAQRRQAVARMGGDLSVRIEHWRATLIDLRAEIEARLDFSDDGDVAAEPPPALATAVAGLVAELRAALAGYSSGRLIREGLRIALAGPPNAGKSSLLNALAKSDLAIVSDEPGTTRDVREVALDLGGQLVILVDMAGLRDATSKAEAEGVRRALDEVAAADLVVWLVAPDVADGPLPPRTSSPVWRIGTKADLRPPVMAVDLVVSAQSGAGLPALLSRLEAFAADAVAKSGLLSHERDREAIDMAIRSLEGANLAELELAAEALRQATHVLSRLVGRIDAEQILDRLFSAFCIGK
jgi:tRNA modification GTPase